MNFWLCHLGPNEWVLPQFLYLIIPAIVGEGACHLYVNRLTGELNSIDHLQWNKILVSN